MHHSAWLRAPPQLDCMPRDCSRLPPAAALVVLYLSRACLTRSPDHSLFSPPTQAPTMRAILAIALLALLAAPALAGPPKGPGNKPGPGQKPVHPKPFKAQGNGTQERGPPGKHKSVLCISMPARQSSTRSGSTVDHTPKPPRAPFCSAAWQQGLQLRWSGFRVVTR